VTAAVVPVATIEVTIAAVVPVAPVVMPLVTIAPVVMVPTIVIARERRARDHHRRRSGQ
jgi:hypothetical protein